MTLALLVALAGGLGSALRHLADQAVRAALSHVLPASSAALPWSTLVINLTGSFALGAITAAAAAGDLTYSTRLVLGVGLCGGYTTFSTAMVDTLQLRPRPVWAALNLLGTVVAATAAAALGWALVA